MAHFRHRVWLEIDVCPAGDGLALRWTWRRSIRVSTLCEVAEMAVPSAAAKELRLETRLPAGAVMLTTHATRLRQVGLNLLSDSVTITAGGSVTLAVDGSEREVAVSVAGTGIGIAPEHLSPSVRNPGVRQADQPQHVVGRSSGGRIAQGMVVSRAAPLPFHDESRFA